MAAAGGEGAALEGRRGTVEDEDWAGAEEEELADATEEAKDWASRIMSPLSSRIARMNCTIHAPPH